MTDLLTALSQLAHVTLTNTELYTQAFTHRSAVNERKSLQHNERLEFLGDAVLELVVTERLYAELSEATEGQMTLVRSSLVKGATLAQRLQQLDLTQYILLSAGEQQNEGHLKMSVRANVFEALIGALYLDQGYEVTRDFLVRVHLEHLPDVNALQRQHDPKSTYQEWSQGVRGVTPEYREIGTSGPEHDRRYKAGVYLSGELIASGEGSSKQKAEVAAARNALRILDQAMIYETRSSTPEVE